MVQDIKICANGNIWYFKSEKGCEKLSKEISLSSFL